jgi:hypothetical protein
MSDRPGDRAVLLACSVGSLRGHWLDMRCSYNANRLPLRPMAVNGDMRPHVGGRADPVHRRPLSAALVEAFIASATASNSI